MLGIGLRSPLNINSEDDFFFGLQSDNACVFVRETEIGYLNTSTTLKRHDEGDDL